MWGGAHLKKLHRAKGGAKMFGVFCVKNHDFMPKNYIFSNFRGGRVPGAPPPLGSAPAMTNRERSKEQAIIYKALHRNLKIKQHKSK